MAEKAVSARIQRILAPDHDVLRDFVAGVVVAVWEVGRIVQFGIAGAKHVVRHGRAGAVARIAAHGEQGVRGSQDGIPEAERIRVGLASRALHDHDGFGAVVLLDSVDVLFDEVERGVPGGFPPGVLAAVGAIAHQGVQDAVFVVDHFFQGKASWAQSPLGDGMLGVAFDLDELSVLHGEDQPATDRMAARGRPSARARRDDAVLLHSPVLAHLILLSHQREGAGLRAPLARV